MNKEKMSRSGSDKQVTSKGRYGSIVSLSTFADLMSLFAEHVSQRYFRKWFSVA